MTFVAIQDGSMPRAKRQNGIGIAVDAPMYTLDGHGAHAVAATVTSKWAKGTGGRTHSRQIATDRAVRRLTPTECEVLQGFPRNWTMVDNMSDSARYRMLGNAVTVNVAEWLGRRVAEALP